VTSRLGLSAVVWSTVCSEWVWVAAGWCGTSREWRIVAVVVTCFASPVLGIAVRAVGANIRCWMRVRAVRRWDGYLDWQDIHY
jgi:hypothetical protein